MKQAHFLFLLVAFAIKSTAFGQGTVSYIYDQQSAMESTGGGQAATMQTNQPLGQSFIPGLSQVGFIRIYTGDRTNNNGIGATLSISLRSDSIIGPALGSTEAVSLADGFAGYTDFIFATPVEVIPGTTYYFQPIVQTGDTWALVSYNYNYPNGIAFSKGIARPDADLWFREGVIVPEPSSAWLGLIGAGVFVWFYRGKGRRNRPQH